MWLFRLRKLVRTAGREALILYFAIRDPATPMPLKLLAMAALGYLFSPLDLLPDIPVLGWVDDLLVVSVGLPMLIRRLPPAVLARATGQSERVLELLAAAPWSLRREATAKAAGAASGRPTESAAAPASARRGVRPKAAAPGATVSRRRQPVSDAKLVPEPAAPRRRRAVSKGD